MNAPVLHVTGGISQRLEGYANLDLEAPCRHPPLGLPEKVGAQIVLAGHHVRAGYEAARLTLGPVRLDAQGIDDENEGPALIVKRVEMNFDVVVAADSITVGEGSVHTAAPAVRLECANAEVDR